MWAPLELIAGRLKAPPLGWGNFVNSMSEVLERPSRGTDEGMRAFSSASATPGPRGTHPTQPCSPLSPRGGKSALSLSCSLFSDAAVFLFLSRSLGMDFYIVLERPGKRVARRKRMNNKVGTCHQVTKEDAMKWFQQKYDGIIMTKRVES